MAIQFLNGPRITGEMGINMAPVPGIDLVVDGFVRFYDGFRVNGNTQIDGELSLGLDLSLNGNDVLTEGGDIIDNNSSAGAVNSFLMSKGTGNGVRWIAVNAASFNAVTSVTTGEPTGSSTITNIVQISKANYQAADTAGTLVTGTAYLIFA
jgi:hypothetical protein